MVFLFSATLVFIPVDMQPLIYHFCFVLLFALSTLISALNVTGRITVSSLFSFWLTFFIHHSWVLVWRAALLLCVFMASTILLNERTDLAVMVAILALSFIVLLTSSLQFDCDNISEQYQVL
jgi:hypothetical protein